MAFVLSNKGLTASGNVAGSHCIPILASDHISAVLGTKCGAKIQQFSVTAKLFTIFFFDFLFSERWSNDIEDVDRAIAIILMRNSFVYSSHFFDIPFTNTPGSLVQQGLKGR